jgi:SPP1 gp7 family putative phage head morphogenesis protein
MPETEHLGTDGSGEKQVTPQVLERSVIETPEATTHPTTGSTEMLWLLGQVADGITPWGTLPKRRDKELREFYPTEDHFKSALAVVTARNMAFSWALDGPPLTVARAQDLLLNADQGRGWESLIAKTSIDLYTQDTSTCWELVRVADSPEAAVIGINHLPASNCWPTGDPMEPVLYQDSHSKFHLLKWYQVVQLAELPVPNTRPSRIGPGMEGLQLCALTRLLRAAQIQKNIDVYTEEKTGGRHTRAIHLLQGVNMKQVEDALEKMRLQADAKGIMRYLNPLLIATPDSEVSIGVETLELTGLPDGFDAETEFRHNIIVMAMAFLTDVQEFAPLFGGSLGSGQQSQILHQKSRGKGAGLFMKLITHTLNERVLPQNVEFGFKEQDLEAEKEQAEVRKVRAETREINARSMDLSPEGVRQEALDDGDISLEVFEAEGGSDITPDVTVDDEEQVPEGEKAERAGPFDKERLADERALTRVVERALTAIGKEVRKRLEREGRGQKALPDVPEDPPFWIKMKDIFLKTVGAVPSQLLSRGVGQASKLGLAVDFDLVNTAVLERAGTFTNEWWAALERSTREGLRKAIQANIETGAPLRTLIKDIEPLFGKARAKVIASTEVTRLYAEGNREAYASAGVEEVEWRTVNDALVDPICEALDGQRSSVGGGQTPPAHPNCRCWLAPVVSDKPLVKVVA